MSLSITRGLYPLWFKEKGCSMYMGFAVLSLLLTSALILNGEKNASVVFAAFIALSSGAGFSWQMIKLSADETTSLIPNKTATILRQGILLLILITAIFVSVCLYEMRFDALKSFAFGALCALGTAIQCRKDPLFFKHITSIYLVASLFVHFIAFVPDWVFWSVCLIVVTGLGFILKSVLHVSWSASALTSYQTGLRSGWSPLSQHANLPSFLNFEKRLFPFSLIAGKSLPAFIYLIASLIALIPVIAYFTPWFSLYVYVISIALPICVLTTRWTMLNAHKTLEMVYLLPRFTSKGAIKKKVVDQFLLLTFGLVTVFWAVATSSRFIQPEHDSAFSDLQIHAICLALLAGLYSLFALANYFTNMLTYSLLLALAMNIIYVVIALFINKTSPTLFELALLASWVLLSIVWNYLSIQSWCKET
jgi:hypothetical protein